MEGLGELLHYIRKLNNVGRWSNEFLHMRASVAEHSFFVTQIAQLLAIIEEENGQKINWEILFKKALNHDVAEALMGDVISTTKNASKESKKALAIVEKDLIEKILLNKLSSQYQQHYSKLFVEAKDLSTEGQILKYADNIDALIECLQEIKLGNKDPFQEKYDMILEKIKKSNLISVQQFVLKILPTLVDGAKKNGD